MELFIHIEGMRCGGCLNRIERTVRQGGASVFEMDLATNNARIVTDDATVPDMLCQAIRALGYRASIVEEPKQTHAAPSKTVRSQPAKKTRTRIPKKTKRLILSGCVALLVVVLFAASRAWTRAAFLERHGLTGLDVIEMVETLERQTGEAEGFRASVTASQLKLGDETGTFVFAMPKDLFYLSIAPYVTQTHPCGNHSLVTCTGELQNRTFHVLIHDESTGEVLHDASIVSSAKGFFGIWLPKNREIRITVHSNLGEAVAYGSTTNDDGTCLTTMMLR
jgi:copper chaperone CopZ